MNLYYAPDLQFPTTVLDENESHHCVKVLRQVNGNKILITNGLGFVYNATIVFAHPKHCQVEITDEYSREAKRNYTLHMAVAPTKSFDRFEWMLEKLTEIGVDEITPIFCDYSERDKLNIERCKKVLVSAMKQCQSGFIPKMNDAIPVTNFLRKGNTTGHYMAHCFKSDKINLSQVSIKSDNITILIGPEGDFSRKELDLAEKLGVKSIHLGNSRLRTETASVYAAAGISVLRTL